MRRFFMNVKKPRLSPYLLPVFFVSGISLVAIFEQQVSHWVFPVLLLLLPYLDPDWQIPRISIVKRSQVICVFLIAISTLLLFQNPETLTPFLFMLVVVALPEEWFFRTYLLQRIESILEGKWRANALTSLVFALLHIPMQGWIGLTVFLPSLIFGCLYQRNKDLTLVVLVHAFFNLIFLIYLKEWLK